MINLAGQTLGRYHILEALGEGGMAAVYKAYDTNLERNVAIKVIRTDKEFDPEFLGRFHREAKALAQLDHPYIVKVLDFGEQNGMPYLVMPFLPGGTLKQKMGSAMPYREAAKLLAPIARALEYAHQQGIIHRDVKPANILITQGGAPMLSDFGLAKMLERTGETQLTRTGVGMGTPDYMAPEQWTGQGDYRSDIYALGIVLYEMVISRKPYIADTPAAVLIKHVNDPLPRPKSFVPSLPDEVEQIIIKALAKRPEDRYQNMGSFAEVLEKLAQGLLVKVDVVSTSETVVRTSPKDVSDKSPKPAGRFSPACIGVAIGGVLIGIVMIGLVALFAVPAMLRSSGTPTNVAANQATKAPTSDSSITTKATLSTTASSTPTGSQIIPLVPGMPGASGQPGKSGQLPPLTTIEGLPTDVPFLKDNNGDLITNTGDEYDMFVYTSKQASEKAIDFFKTEMKTKGWTLANTMTSKQGDNNSTMLQYQKSSRFVMITVVQDLKNNQIQVVTMVVKKT